MPKSLNIKTTKHVEPRCYAYTTPDVKSNQGQ